MTEYVDMRGDPPIRLRLSWRERLACALFHGWYHSHWGLGRLACWKCGRWWQP